jgi:uncharacterized protein (DUF2062 family)
MSRIGKYIVELLRNWMRRLTQIRDTPHAIAGGVAIGFVFGFTPLFGFKTLIAVLLAWIFRCSKLSAALAVTFHDILLPILPAIVVWQYKIGFFILSHPHRLPPKFKFKNLYLENFFTFKNMHDLWLKVLHDLWPTFLGSLLLAVPLAVVLYFLVIEIVTRAQAAMAAKAKGDRGLPMGGG